MRGGGEAARTASRVRPSSIIPVISSFLAVLVLLAVVLRSLLLEEEDEEEGEPGSYDGARVEPPAGTLPHEAQYLDSVYEAMGSYSRTAKRRLRRYYLMNTLALASSGAVPVAVAASSPGWVVAALGGVAVTAQGVQQLLHDHEIGAESHALAVALGRALRRFHFRAGASTGEGQRALFAELVEVVEDLRVGHGTVVLDLVRRGAEATILPTR